MTESARRDVAPPHLTPLASALADRYRIERELGAGGMATVYLAHDLRHDRKVAVKVLKPELAVVLGAERFVVEIKTTASLQHPHILPLFDSGAADGFLFYVMPYVEGETLRDKLNRETQLGVDEALRIATEIADALDYAHRHGVIHRDIKPENILLHDGRPVVADFGIALALSAAAGGRMTETGLSLGTPHYMSPEQATADKEITGRADIYSLASVLYEMLAGQPPHVGASAQQIIMKIIAAPVEPVTKFRKSVPPHVAASIAKALEKLPADRFESARAFKDALGDRQFTSTSMTAAFESSAMSSTWTSWLRDPHSLSALTAVAAIALVAVVATRPPATSTDSRTLRFTVAGPTDSTVLSLTARPGMAIAEPVVSPDNRYVAFSVNRSDGPTLYIRALDSFELREVPGGGHWPFFSPDGSTLGFVRNTEVWTANVRDLTPGRIGVIAERSWDIISAAWHPNGRILFTGAIGLWSLPARGGEPTLILAADSAKQERFEMLSVFSDGRILVNIMTPVERWAEVLSADARQRRRIAPGWEQVRVIDDVLIFVQGGQARASRFDAGSVEPTGAPVALPQITLTAANGPWAGYFSASDGQESAVGFARRLAHSIAWRDDVSARTLAPVWVSRSGGVTPIRLPRGFYRWPRLSPDGRRLVFGVRSYGASNQLRAVDLARGTVTQMGGSTEPVWSLDGRWIYASTGNRPLGGLVRQVSDARLPPDTLLRLPTGDAWPTDFSRDGKWLAFYGATLGMGDDTDKKDQNDLHFIDVATRQIRRVRIAGEQRGARFSPDGTWVAFESTETGRDEIYVRPWPAMDANFLVSTDGGTEPLWSADGRELFYRNKNDVLSVAIASRSGRIDRAPPRVLFSGVYYRDEYGDQSWEVAPDGRFLMMQPLAGTRVEFRVALNWIEEVRARLDSAR